MQKRKGLTVQLISTTILIMTAFCLTTFGFADTIGNPGRSLEAGSFQICAEAGMWNRDMELEGVDDEDSVEGKRIILKAIYGINEKIDIYGKVGMADSEFDLYGYEVKTDMAIAYGGGARVQFYNEGQIKAGFVIQFLSLTGKKTEDVEDTYIDALGINYSGKIKGEVDAMEIDAAVGASREINDDMDLYAGLYYSKLNAELTGTISDGSDSLDADESDPLGIFIGGEYRVNENITMGAEGRFLAEQSFSISGGIIF